MPLASGRATRVVTQYLERHASDEAIGVGGLGGLRAQYARALVVPVHRESSAFLRGFVDALAAASGPTLLIIVVNATADDAERHAAEHAQLISELVSGSEVAGRFGDMVVVRDAHHDRIVVDRAHPQRALPSKQGVGLARRIGCDMALSLYAGGRLASPWLHNTDADATLPSGHFSRTESPPQSGAACVFPFVHTSGADPSVDRATALYELKLRYYVASLAWARSPYAFHALGSALSVHAESYAAVRGFPRRRAGEDFYLLNKLAKLGEVRCRAGEPIQLRSRASLRTPHGTGRSALDIAGLADPEQFELYHPRSFRLLAAWLSWLEGFAERPQAEPRLTRELWQAVEPFAAALRSSLDGLGAFAAARAAAGATAPGSALRRRLHTWFDAFRTLKLLHALRARGLASLPYRAALAQSDWMPPAVARTLPVPELVRCVAQVEAQGPSQFGATLGFSGSRLPST